MSRQLGMWDNGLGGPESGPGQQHLRASLGREIRYLLTCSTRAGQGFWMKPSGLSYSMSVCLLEDFNMSRGKGLAAKQGNGAGMPRFVDVKLTAEQRNGFAVWSSRAGDLVTFIQSLADDGYRVGVSWSGEQQAYTVSLTCRAEGNVNNGLCMTSFARTLETALWLAIYKHVEVTQEKWVEGGFGGMEDFG